MLLIRLYPLLQFSSNEVKELLGCSHTSLQQSFWDRMAGSITPIGDWQETESPRPKFLYQFSLYQLSLSLTASFLYVLHQLGANQCVWQVNTLIYKA